jgi:hypothetical protein
MWLGSRSPEESRSSEQPHKIPHEQREAVSLTPTSAHVNTIPIAKSLQALLRSGRDAEVPCASSEDDTIEDISLRPATDGMACVEDMEQVLSLLPHSR